MRSLFVKSILTSMFVGLALLASSGLGIVSANAAEDLGEQARQILADSGIQGGLIVHLGCGDGKLTTALRANNGYLVQGLDTDAENVRQARAHVQSLGLYGDIAIDRYDGKNLPFIENLVNLIVIRDTRHEIRDDELKRVLAPRGRIIAPEGTRIPHPVSRIENGFVMFTKPVPSEIDEWTHYLHDASNNAVAHDTMVGPPRHLQWLGGPRYSRQHDHMSGASAMVSANGRLFHIFDYASPFSIQLPSDWRLAARDAFNGKTLWQRDIDEWHTQMFRLKSGPAQLTRRLVAIGDVVYVTLGLEAPVSALDAATGETIRTYKGTDKTEEIIYSDGVLFLVMNENPFRQPRTPGELNYDFVEGSRRIVAVDAETGKVLWNQPQANVLPITLTADDKHVLFCGDERIVCLDRADGTKLWQSNPVMRRKSIPTFFGLTLVAYKDVVLFSGGSSERDAKNATGDDNTMYAFDAATGRQLWTADHPASGYKSAEDILVMNDLVWITENTFGNQSGVVIGLEPRTGKEVKRFLPDVETHWFHHRCYRAKATDNYLLFSRTGIEFVDPTEEHWECHHWVRGACLYGIMPANGMIYNPPHPCACYLEAKLYGFNALAPKRKSQSRRVEESRSETRLEKGPAYENLSNRQPTASSLQPSADWPTYRRDASRSGFTKIAVPAELKQDWSTEIGGRLSSVVIADGKLFVASIDTHTVHALDAESGEAAWSYTTGGRVDSPPTIWQGRVLFGATDGYVYCLRASDGELAWRFRAAPADLRMSMFEQLESVWPVHGSVLLRDGELWCVAGRSLFLDGGLRLIRLDPATGRLIAESVIDDRDPDSDDNLQVRLKGLNMPVALNDVLSYDGKYVYMRSQRFDEDGVRHEVEVPTLDVSQQWGEGPHLFCPTGFLDDIWWHRSYWVYGRVWKSGAGGYYQAGRVAPAGRPMVFNDTTVYGFGRKPQYYKWTTPLEYQLFATPKKPERVSMTPRQPAAKTQTKAADRPKAKAKRQPTPKPKRKRGGVGRAPNTRIAFDWTQNVPVLTRAMVLADETLFIAGPPDVVDEEESLAAFAVPATQERLAKQAAILNGSEGALLWAVSTDGTKLSEQKLKCIPVFDGMAAAGGRLYMATTDGKVICMGGKE